MDWLRARDTSVIGKSLQQQRKYAITFLVNQVLDLDINLKSYKCNGHVDAVSRPHKAYTKEEVIELIDYARK